MTTHRVYDDGQVVRLTDQDGHVDTYGMGDGFVIPMGFKGTWETLKPVRKWYVIWQPK